jgi:transcriptional regulator with XRE-family HTH domain
MSSFALSASVGRKIRELRVVAGIPRRQLARQAGLRVNALVAIESGRVRPSVATLEALAKPLHVTLVELVRSVRAGVRSAPPSLGRGLEGIARAVANLPPSVGDKIDAVGAAVVEHAVDVCGGNQSAAARLLGMERKAFSRRWERARREAKKRRQRSV